MRCLLSLLWCLLIVSAYADDDQDELIVSTPGVIAAITSDESSLVKEMISPLSGQLVLRETDLVVKGAQNVVLNRIYAPPYMPCSFPKDSHVKGDVGQFNLYNHLSKHYKGWQFLPHLRIKLNPFSREVRVPDPNGMILDFHLSDPGCSATTLVTPSYAITNTAGDFPSGKYDPRNTRISYEGDKITVYGPDGSVRPYQKLGSSFIYLLQKEILPNGKVLKYYYQDPKNPTQLTCLVSTDPNERHTYASITLQGSPLHGNCHFIASDGRTVDYKYKMLEFKGEIKQKKHGKADFNYLSPPILISASSPFYRNETLQYSDPPLLQIYSGKEKVFDCHYACYGEGLKHFKVYKVFLPVGKNDAWAESCELSYLPPVEEKREGSTTVKNSDGTTTVYEFSRSLLMTAVKYFDQGGNLKKQKLFSWYENHWLQSIEMKDGQNRLLHRRYYEYDKNGNPILEVFTGDLIGSGPPEDYRIQRVFTDDGRNLLLLERSENGKVVCYSYLPNTNLIIEKLTKDGDKILLREFCEYDDCYNLVKKITDDGVNIDKSSLLGVTQRTITNYILRQTAPFLHMPERIEEKYLEDGVEKYLMSRNLVYDGHGNVGREVIYGADGKIAYVLDKKYNERGDLILETNAIGQEAIYGYDPRGHRDNEVNFSARVHTTMRYDTNGRAREKTECGDDGVVHATTFDYDFQDRLIQKTDPFGNSTYLAYDPLTSQVTRTDLPPIASLESQAAGVTIHSTYDPFGRETSKTDANGHTTTCRYNAYGSPIEIVHPDGGKEYFLYAKNGELASYTDQDELTIKYDRDILGRTLAKTYIFEGRQLAQETFTYSAFNLLSETDKEGNLRKYSYDGAGRKTREEFCGRIIECEYDPLGYLCTVSKRNGENTLLIHYKRDLLGHIIEEEKTDISGKSLYKVCYTYDKDGNRETIKRSIDDREAIDTFSYDSFNRLTLHRDPQGFVTHIVYDENHTNLLHQKVLKTETTDPRGITTVITKDAFDRTVKKEVLNPHRATISCQEIVYDPRGNISCQMDRIYENEQFQSTQMLAYSYTPNDRIASQTRAFGTKDARTTTYTYTPSGRMLTKTLPDGVTLTHGYDTLGFFNSLSSSDGKIQHVFEHDKLGHLLSASDQNVTIKREIDPFGNVTKEVFSTGLEVEKEYDAFGRLKVLKTIAQGAVAYTYDPLFLKSVTRISSTGRILYRHRYDHYDLDGNLISEHLIGSLGQVIHSLDLSGRQTQLASSFFSQAVRYDPCGNLITSVIDNAESRYTYDDLSQLNSETGPEPSVIYAYDSVYNRVSGEISEINALNELLTQNLTHFSYNPNGNQNLKQSPTEATHFIYDPLNRLIEVQSDQKRCIFTYDPLGRRLGKVLYTSSFLGWKEAYREFYLYDGQNEIGAFDADLNPKNLKVLGLGKQNPSAIAIELEDKIFAPILDIQGSVCRLIDLNSRSIADSYDFTAFGVAKRISEQRRFNPWRFASKRLDPEFNLVYFGKRYYDPEFARWLTTDPAGFVDSINLYQYVFNNPFRYGDPDGQFVIEISLVALTWKLVAAAIVYACVAYELEHQAHRHSSNSVERAFNSAVHQVAQNMGGMATNALSKIKEVYAPDRPLPLTPDGVQIPDVDVPHTQLGTREGRKGKHPQAREFDEHGNPVRDIDFTDHSRPQNHPNPHQHKWNPNPTGGTPARDPKGQPLEIPKDQPATG